MIDVVQVWRSVHVIEKPDYTSEKRISIGKWEDSLVSYTGYLKDGTLYLPVREKRKPDLSTADVAILQDIPGFDPFLAGKSWEAVWEGVKLPDWFKNMHKPSTERQLVCISQLSRPKDFEIFGIHKNQLGILDLHLNYSKNEFLIGIPVRDDHKIAELRPGSSIRYRINGKSDFTFSGRKQRTFTECDYIIEYLGRASKIEFLERNQIGIDKKIPADYKLIDERKILK